ncbi:hypothetical protein [Polluticaenibacter yanchengensis]|uniref:Outer membrane lipoprotein-sorting protein n=1 Tax=Polluticaenibacter yanchengensis TaxID=3014562 RepID=A0ABT4UL39_9BACT|nr:hypothetical protein [Chitinophagaceae bacterium LY-5]
MNHRIALYLIAFLSVLKGSSQGNVSAETLNAEFLKIQNAYKTNEMLKLNVYSFIGYPDRPGNIDSNETVYYMMGDKIRGNLSDGSVYMMNDKYAVYVLPDSKEMIIDTINLPVIKDPRFSPFQLLDTTLLDSLISFHLSAFNSEHNILKIYPKHGAEISEASIIYNKTNGRIRKSTYYLPYQVPVFRSDSSGFDHVEKNYKLSMIFDDQWVTDQSNDYFDEKSFFSISNGKYRGVSLYSGYTIKVIFRQEEDL